MSLQDILQKAAQRQAQILKLKKAVGDEGPRCELRNIKSLTVVFSLNRKVLCCAVQVFFSLFCCWLVADNKTVTLTHKSEHSVSVDTVDATATDKIANKSGRTDMSPLN